MVHFYNIFVFQSLLKDEAALKISFFPVPALTVPFHFLFSVPGLTIPFPFLFPELAFTILFPVNKFPNKLAPKVPNKILKNPPFCSFVLFYIVLVTPFNKISKSSRD